MAGRRKKKARPRGRNQNAHVVTVANEQAMFGGMTKTRRRDDEFEAHIETDTSNKTLLTLTIDFDPYLVQEGLLVLDGRQARLLQRLLNKHYELVGRSPTLLGA